MGVCAADKINARGGCVVVIPLAILVIVLSDMYGQRMTMLFDGRVMFVTLAWAASGCAMVYVIVVLIIHLCFPSSDNNDNKKLVFYVSCILSLPVFACGIGAIVMYNRPSDEFEPRMNHLAGMRHKDHGKARINAVLKDFQCCGIRSLDDWEVLPDGCCETMNQNGTCDKDHAYSTDCQHSFIRTSNNLKLWGNACTIMLLVFCLWLIVAQFIFLTCCRRPNVAANNAEPSQVLSDHRLPIYKDTAIDKDNTWWRR